MVSGEVAQLGQGVALLGETDQHLGVDVLVYAVGVPCIGLDVSTSGDLIAKIGCRVPLARSTVAPSSRLQLITFGTLTLGHVVP